MKTEHSKQAKRSEVQFKLRPKHGLYVQVSQTERLHIEPGDTLDTVGKALARSYPMLNAANLKKLAHYYFMLGERLASTSASKRPWIVERPGLGRKFKK